MVLGIRPYCDELSTSVSLGGFELGLQPRTRRPRASTGVGRLLGRDEADAASAGSRLEQQA